MNQQRVRSFFFASAITTSVGLVGCNKPPEATTTPTASPSSPTSATMGNVSDVDVTEHVKTALLQSNVLKGFSIDVVTLKGDVRLIGELQNQAQIDEAIKVARASDGVHSIHDELTIKQ